MRKGGNSGASGASEGKSRRGEGVAESKPSHAAKEAAAAAAAAAAKAAAAPALAKQGKGRQQHLSLSPGLVDWLATGVLLREAAKAEGLDRLLLDLGKEHFGQVRIRREKGLIACIGLGLVWARATIGSQTDPLTYIHPSIHPSQLTPFAGLPPAPRQELRGADPVARAASPAAGRRGPRQRQWEQQQG